MRDTVTVECEYFVVDAEQIEDAVMAHNEAMVRLGFRSRAQKILKRSIDEGRELAHWVHGDVVLAFYNHPETGKVQFVLIDSSKHNGTIGVEVRKSKIKWPARTKKANG